MSTSVIRRKSSFRRARRFVGSLASRAVSRARARAASVGLFTHWLAGVRQNMRVRIPSILILWSLMCGCNKPLGQHQGRLEREECPHYHTDPHEPPLVYTVAVGRAIHCNWRAFRVNGERAARSALPMNIHASVANCARVTIYAVHLQSIKWTFIDAHAHVRI